MPWLPQESYVALGAVLAAARRDAGATQEQVAARLRKPQSFVSSYERGQRRIDLLEFLAIADALPADPEKVFGDVLSAVRTSSGGEGGARRRRRRVGS